MEEPKSTEINHVTRDTDIHMHPILLQNPFEDSIHYHHTKYGMGAQIPFNILQEMHNTLTFIQYLLTLTKWHTETPGCSSSSSIKERNSPIFNCW